MSRRYEVRLPSELRKKLETAQAEYCSACDEFVEQQKKFGFSSSAFAILATQDFVPIRIRIARKNLEDAFEEARQYTKSNPDCAGWIEYQDQPDRDPPIHPDHAENPLCDLNTILIAALAIAALVIGLLF